MADDSRTLKQQVELAAETEPERCVEEGRDERGCQSDRQSPRHSDEVQQQADADDEQADSLREPRRARILELSRRMPGVYAGADSTVSWVKVSDSPGPESTTS